MWSHRQYTNDGCTSARCRSVLTADKHPTQNGSGLKTSTRMVMLISKLSLSSSARSAGKFLSVIQLSRAFLIRPYRRILANSNFLIPHRTPPHNEPFPPSMTCAHHFLDPLSWMRPELEQGKLEGRLECPKCSSNVGKYAWQGMRCSCGAWVVPAITLAGAKVDQLRKNPGATGIRRGPGVAMPPTAAQGRGLL